MLSSILALLGTVLGGGATGLLGVLVQRYFDAKNKSQDLQILAANHAHEQAMARIESERTAFEWESREKIAKADAEAEMTASENIAQARTQVASYSADKATYLTAGLKLGKGRAATFIRVMLACVDALRGVMRPGLTLALTWMTWEVYRDLYAQVVLRSLDLPATVTTDLVLQVVQTIMYLATVAVVWWFGTRPPKQTGAK